MLNILWFRQYLRLHDNPSVSLACQGDLPVVALYILPRQWLTPGASGFDRLGAAKSKFLLQALEALSVSLSAAGVPFEKVVADPVALLTQWHGYAPIRVITHIAQAPEERAWIKALRGAGIDVVETESQTLFSTAQMRYTRSNYPPSFSQFRRQIEASGVHVPAPAERPQLDRAKPGIVPRAVLDEYSATELLAARSDHLRPVARAYFDLPGGEEQAVAWMEEYLYERRAVDHYKDTRNFLVGPDYSSRFSAYLATGCLSVRLLWQAIEDYEARFGASEHSGWLKFELLWREYFHWAMRAHGRQLFSYRGLSNRLPLRHGTLSMSQSNYWQCWCSATTGLPFIDACLRELKATGYLSNRGRQILASFLIYDMNCDWRWGAEFFQHYLVDDDVACNWGNWAYIAGAGLDPRGGRRFNIIKQLRQYDPYFEQINQWLPELRELPAQRLLDLHFTYANDESVADYLPAMLVLPDSDRRAA